MIVADLPTIALPTDSRQLAQLPGFADGTWRDQAGRSLVDCLVDQVGAERADELLAAATRCFYPAEPAGGVDLGPVTVTLPRELWRDLVQHLRDTGRPDLAGDLPNFENI